MGGFTGVVGARVGHADRGDLRGLLKEGAGSCAIELCHGDAGCHPGAATWANVQAGRSPAAFMMLAAADLGMVLVIKVPLWRTGWLGTRSTGTGTGTNGG